MPRRALVFMLLLLAQCTSARTTSPLRPPAAAPVFAGSSTPTAEPAAPAVVTTSGAGIRPCAPDSPAARRAAAEIAGLSADIQALAPDGDPRSLAESISRVVREGECFALLRAEGRSFVFDSSAAIKKFWTDGGRAWMQQVLDYSGTGEWDRHAWLPPTPRKRLHRDTSPGHPLASLVLCPRDDPRCGAETRPWRRRAEAYFVTVDILDRLRSRGAPHRAEGEACAARAKAKPPALRFAGWHACFQEEEDRYSIFPVGEFQAPREGWLVVRGRRGHYEFCDEVRAYDLATGAAFVARSCSGLALGDGGVDAKKTDAARKLAVQVGRVPVETLREAMWMISLVDEVQHHVALSGSGWPIPRSIDIVLPDGANLERPPLAERGGSNQTSLAWSWTLRGASVVRGELSWPGDMNYVARDHAVNLLDIAELGLVEGCPPAQLPDLVKLVPPEPGVSEIDAEPAAVRRVQKDLLGALTKLRRTPACAL